MNRVSVSKAMRDSALAMRVSALNAKSAKEEVSNETQNSFYFSQRYSL